MFVTDSFRPTLWHLTAAQVRAGQGTPEAISVAPEVTYVAGAFNLNGIVPLDNNTLITVNSNITCRAEESPSGLVHWLGPPSNSGETASRPGEFEDS